MIMTQKVVGPAKVDLLHMKLYHGASETIFVCEAMLNSLQNTPGLSHSIW